MGHAPDARVGRGSSVGSHPEAEATVRVERTTRLDLAGASISWLNLETRLARRRACRSAERDFSFLTPRCSGRRAGCPPRHRGTIRRSAGRAPLMGMRRVVVRGRLDAALTRCHRSAGERSPPRKVAIVSLLIIGLICWLAILVLVLAVLRAAALADRAAERHALELGAELDPPVADEDSVTMSPGRTRHRFSVPGRAAALPWVAAAVTLTAVAMTVGRLGGAAAVGVLAIAVGVCAGLLGAIVAAWRRGMVIERQARELGIRRAAMLGLSLRLLALRDPAAAQHAAAVAHHARVLAGAAALSEREQQIVHSAGLLHDIGRQLFPDELLTGDRQLDEADRRAIRAHPLTGARLLRTVAGFEEVAAAVEAHHERIDGTGYPRGLRGDRIPHTARIVAIAEVYDVLTAPDSYRSGRDHDWAARELRRVANTQLDARLVELFLTTISPPRPRPSLDHELTAARIADLPHAHTAHG
jgi:putative nucleotidyltransferase with HDIG domain